MKRTHKIYSTLSLRFQSYLNQSFGFEGTIRILPDDASFGAASQTLGAACTPIAEIISGRIGERVTVGGIVVGVKKITTKAGNHEMAFVKLEDLTGTIEIVVFPKIYSRTLDGGIKDQILSVSGKVDEKMTG